MKSPWVLALLSRRGCAATIMGLGILLLSPIPILHAKVFFALDEALKLAFPDADRVEPRTFILKEAELKRAEKLSRTRIDSNLFTFYVGSKNGRILGYAAIESHQVRTLPETILVVISPEGKVLSTVVLAFHEPLEYMPSDRWLGQLDQRGLTPGLWPGREIAGIFGSTLTVHAVTGGVRKVLALFQILVKEHK